MIRKSGLVVLAAVEDAENRHRSGCVIRVERDDGPMPVVGDSQARTNVVASGSPVWQLGEAFAVCDDGADVSRCGIWQPLFVRNVRVERDELVFRLRREDDPPGGHLKPNRIG